MNIPTSDSLVGRVVNGWFRHAVSLGCGGMVVHGYMTHAQEQQVIGAVMTLFPIALSTWSKMRAASKLQDAQIALLQAQLKKGQVTP